MSRIAIMVRLANGGTDHASFSENSSSPLLYSLLSEARTELQSTLKDVADAAQNGSMDDNYRVADYFLHDTKTGHSYDVAWAPKKTDLLVRLSHQEILSKLVQLLAAPDPAAGEYAFQLDAAKTALEFGLADHRNTLAIILPSQDGPNWDKHAIAPRSMGGATATDFVNQVCARANQEQAAIDDETAVDDGTSVAERIDLYLEEAGFTVLSNDAGNVRIARPWDAHEPDPAEEPASAPRV